MSKDQWKAHCKFIREVIRPAAIRAALARPMTEDDKRSLEEYERLFNEASDKK